MNEHVALANLSRAEQMLATASSLDEVKKIINMAEAARVWARAAKIGESAAQLAEEIKLKAQRKAGEFIRQLEKGKGGAGSHRSNSAQAGPSYSPLRRVAEDAGLDRHEVVRFQRVAAVPEPQFHAYIEAKKTAGGEITQAELLKTVRADQKEEEKAALVEQIRTEPLPPPKGPFRVIVIDPPWRYSARAADSTHRARNPYPDMDLDAIKALPIAALAHENSIVWLWCPNAFHSQASECLIAWGFEEKTMLTWDKDKIGLGDWLRGQTEQCLFAVRGHPIVTLTNQSTMLRAPASVHSAKPDEFYELVDSLCPGNKLEMFARAARSGWTVCEAEAPLESPGPEDFKAA